MCGIAGWLDSAPRSESDLQAMAQAMAHRGPDDRGFHYDAAAGLALGHNRLSIIDLSAAGHEPMFNEDSSVVLTFNGEIYNFRALRQELISAGHVFRSATDCEVVVHGYEEWGEAVVARLEGMFAFALWDAGRRGLLLARDPMGIKPLYWWTSPTGGLYFASEVKAFLALPDFRADVHPRALRQFLELNYIYEEEQSSLQGVRKLPAGHILTTASGKAPRKSRYFSPPSPAQRNDPAFEDECVERLHDVLSEVVAQHLVADVPVALLLSGGLDSSTVAALAARQHPLRTITMAFADSRVDERSFARIVSDRLGTEHQEILIRPEDVVDEVLRSTPLIDDLFGDWGFFSTLILYRQCREAGVKVVLVGEGSDELFGGYPWFDAVGGEAADATSFLRRGLHLYRSYSSRRWGRELIPFLRTLSDLSSDAGDDFFSAIRLFESQRQLPNFYNMKVDKASMAASVEARVPFLDVRVARLAYGLPRNLLLRGNSNKYVLRRMGERFGLLPPEIAHRAKFGGSMAASWMDDSPRFRGFAREVVLDPAGWVDELSLRRPMEDYFSGRRRGYGFPHGMSIFSTVAWRVLLLNLWSRYYLRPRALAA
jgi:asparagine synthase (glutamine-hydrolysing)